MMTHPILYSYRRCPYAMRGRMGLYIAGINPEVREISFKDKPAHMLEISPKGTVPVLQLEDGTVIEESLEVLLYALSQNDPEGWLNLSDEEKKQAESLIADNDGQFKVHLDRYKYPGRYEAEFAEGETREDFQAKHKQGLLDYLKGLDSILANSAYLLRDEISYVDIALFPFLRQLSKVEPEWFEAAGYDHLRHWLTGLIEAPFFTAIMKKHDTWSDGDEPAYLF